MNQELKVIASPSRLVLTSHGDGGISNSTVISWQGKWGLVRSFDETTNAQAESARNITSGDKQS